MDKSLTLCFQAGSYSEALQWYNYSLSLFKGGQMEPNLAKLQRNRASCFLKLKQLEKVRELEAAVVGNFKNTSIYMSLVTTEGVPGIFFLQLLHANMFSSVLKILIFVRPKKQLRKHRDVIQTTFLLSLAYTRWLCRRMRQRKVPKKDYLLGLGRFINHTSVAIITAIFSPYYF